MPFGMALQKRFFDYYLKGEQNGWDKEPRVWLNLRRPFSKEFQLRKENEWPLAGTRWTKLFLDAKTGALDWRAPSTKGSALFAALGDGVKWMSPPLEQSTEITGPMALKIYVSSSTADADLFVTVQAFAPDGREVDFQGTIDPHTPLAQGWLRASHRKLDQKKSLPYRPYHTHDDKQPLIPKQVYELDIEIWPMCIVLPAGFRIAVILRARTSSVQTRIRTRRFVHVAPDRGCTMIVMTVRQRSSGAIRRSTPGQITKRFCCCQSCPRVDLACRFLALTMAETGTSHDEGTTRRCWFCGGESCCSIDFNPILNIVLSVRSTEGRSHEASCGVGSDAAPAGVPRKARTRAAPGLRLAANRGRPPGAG